MVMDYLYVKSLHVIFVITWFSGLFYIVRLFIYFKEAGDESSPAKEILQKQFGLMIKRLWYMITWPSAVLATLFAIWLLVLNPYWLQETWMQIKLVFVAILFLYHGICQYMCNQVKRGHLKFSSFSLRIWNEVATILLFAIIFLVVLKNSIGWVFGVSGIIGVSVLLMLGIKLYKNVRKRNRRNTS